MEWILMIAFFSYHPDMGWQEFQSKAACMEAVKIYKEKGHPASCVHEPEQWPASITQNDELEHTCFNERGSAVVECPRVATPAQAKDKPWPCSQCTNGWVDSMTGMCPYRPYCKTRGPQ